MKEAKPFLISLIILALGYSVAFAAPFYRQEASIVPIDSTENVGTSTNRWAEGWFTDLNVTSCTGCSFAFPFTPTSWGNSTSTTLGFLNGFLSAASSTVASTTVTSNLTLLSNFIFDGDLFDSLTDDTTLANNSGDLQVVDVTCTDCLSTTEIDSSIAISARNFTIAGTANQITSSAGAQDLSADRTWTLSLPNHIIFPSSFQVDSASSSQATSTNFHVSGKSITLGTNYAHITGTTTPSFSIASTTMPTTGLGTGFKNGTSTYWLRTVMLETVMVRGVSCSASTTGVALLRFGDQAGNYTNTIEADTGQTRTYQPLTTNNTWTSGEDMTVQASSTSGLVQRINCTMHVNTTSP